MVEHTEGRQRSQRSIRIVQHNMQRARIVTDEIRSLLHSQGVDVLLAQEPYSWEGKMPGLERTTKLIAEGDRPMAAIAVTNRDLTVVKISHLCDTHLSCACVKGNFGEFYLVSQYFQCSEEIEPSLTRLEKVLAALSHNKVVIAADVNGKSTLWGSTKTNARGRKLEEFVARHGLVVLNEAGSMPTYSSSSGESFIDVTFATPDMSDKVRGWKVQRDLTSSDHRVIRFSLQFSATDGNRHREGRFHLDSANMQKFERALLESKRNLTLRPSCREEVEQLALEFEQSIVQACESSMRTKRWHSKSVPWWTPELTRRKKQVYRCRRAFQNPRLSADERADRKAEYLVQRKAYSAAVRVARYQSWKDFVTEQGNKEPWGLVYKISRQKLNVETAVSNIRTSDGHTMDWESTASALLESLVPDDTSVSDTPEQAQLRLEAATEPTTEDDPVFRRSELEEAVKRLKRRKCPGLDRIEPEVLKFSAGILQAELLRLYNSCLEYGVFPSRWKVGSIRTILKGPDKPQTEVKSYRPICLLSVVGKVFEKLIASRLANLFLSPEYASDRQYGFRPERSTEDAVVKLRSLVSSCEDKYILALAFDISGAFDNLWWPSILNELRRRGCPANLYKLMADYFANRVVVLKSTHGEVRKVVTKGCPQGSILGPSCWNLVFDRVLQILNGLDCEPIAYADDLIVLVSGNSRKELRLKGQGVADAISACCHARKLSLSAPKTEMVLLKGCLDRGRPPVVKIDGKSITMKDTIRYLGVYIDKRLGVKSHVEHVSVKSTKTFSALTKIARSNWGLGYRAMRTMYTSLFVPITAYAAAGWADLLTSQMRTKLMRAQRRVLLGCTKAYRTVSTDAITVIAGAVPIDLVIAERACAYKIRKLQSVEYETCQISQADLANGVVSPREALAEVRRTALAKWQRRWSSSTKGRTTFKYFNDVSDRLSARWVIPDHYVSQFVSGHGDFRAKLKTFTLVEDEHCECGEVETPSHILYDCPLYDQARETLRQAAEANGQPWPVQEASLVTEQLFTSFRNFARDVLREKARTRGVTI